MRLVLFDENLPRQLRRSLSEFAIRTVQEEGFGSFRNGQLLRRAEGKFEVLVTADRRMRFEQNLASFALGVVIIRTPRQANDASSPATASPPYFLAARCFRFAICTVNRASVTPPAWSWTVAVAT